MSFSNPSPSNLLPSSGKLTHSSPNPNTPPPGGPAPVRIRSSLRRGGNLLLDLPISGRLTLGFLTAALIATLTASSIGVLRSQSLSRQSDFYQNLLQTNTSLNLGANALQSMNTKTDELLTIAIQQTSKETQTQDQTIVQNLSNRYDQILSSYLNVSMVEKHPDEVALLNEGDHSDQINQQRTLVASAIRTWHLYKGAQKQLLLDIANNQMDDAQTLLRVQNEPANADAQSALRSLIQLDQHLATSVHDAASIEEQQQVITTILGSILAFFVIVLVGWLISGTLVKRLKQLRHITRLVESGQVGARVTVIGRDEIADVSASVNAMLDAIVGLVDETRHQRDALTNAAEHLFSDMRVVSAGDLRINAPVSNDPIGMLANAFNFTVGRFRRFVLRTQSTMEQVEVISRQELERAENFSIALTNYIASPAFQNTTGQANPSNAPTKIRTESNGSSNMMDAQNKEILQRVKNTREYVQKLSGSEGFARHTRAILALAEQITQAINKLSRALPNNSQGQMHTPSGSLAQMHVQELRTLETLLQRLTVDLQGIQHTTTKNLLDLDNDLAHLSGVLSLPKTAIQENNNVLTRTKDTHLELVRQGQSFATDITVIARKLSSLAQEMRAGAVSFQLDTGDAGQTLDSGSNVYGPFSGPNAQGNLTDTSSKLPSRGNSVPLRSSSLY